MSVIVPRVSMALLFVIYFSSTLFCSEKALIFYGNTIDHSVVMMDSCSDGATAGIITALDPDADGINNICDLDDDNDGILDGDESPDCFLQIEEFSLDTLYSELNWSSSRPVTWAMPGVASYAQSSGSSQNWVDKTIFEMVPDGPVAINGVTIEVRNILSSSSSSTFRLEGYNGASWEPLSVNYSATTSIDLFVENSVDATQLYENYRIVGVAGTMRFSSRIDEVRFNINQSVYMSSRYPKDGPCSNNQDGDAFANHLDNDSDADGCPDAIEGLGGLTSLNVNGNGQIIGNVDGNGIPISLSPNGQEYTIAILDDLLQNNNCPCTDANLFGPTCDFDGDGFLNYEDDDDDNDGILDINEGLTCSSDQTGAQGISGLILAGYHSGILRSNNSFIVWGGEMAADGFDQDTMTEISPANGYTYAGTPTHITLVGNDGGLNTANGQQTFMVTTEGYYVWGVEDFGIDASFTSSRAFQSISGPPVSPEEVGILQGGFTNASFGAFVVVSKEGDVYTTVGDPSNLTGSGDNSAGIWHRVVQSDGIPVTKIIDIELNGVAAIAKSIDGKYYAWGSGARLGDGAGATNLIFATEMTAPPVPSAKLVSPARDDPDYTYLMLGEDGRIYGLGSATGNIWAQVSSLTDVVDFDASGHNAFHHGYLAKTGDGNLYSWGENSEGMLAQGTANLINNPTLVMIQDSATSAVRSWDVLKDQANSFNLSGHLMFVIDENKSQICFSGHVLQSSDAGLSLGSSNELTCWDLPESVAGSICVNSLNTDGDLYQNWFDNDSDNDGCPDAVEGTAGILPSQLDINGQLSGPYTGSGVPQSVNSGSGQDSGESTDNTINSCPENTTTAENDINQIPQDSTAQGNVLVNDVDAEDEDQDVSSIDTDGDGIPDTTPTAGNPISISSGGSPLGSITIDPETGEYSFTPESGFTGTVEIPMEICDSGSPQVCTGSVLTIEVIGNPSPTANNEVIAQDDTNTQEQGETTTFPILGNDNDPDGDAISVSAISGLDMSGSPVSLTTTPTDVYDGAGNLAGQASVNANGEVIFTADNNFTGQVPIDYTISDGNGGSDSAQYVITVEESDATDNDTYANDDANLGEEGEQQTGDVSLNDNDPEGHPTTLSGATDVNGDPLTLGSSSSLPSGGTITLNDDGSYTYDPAPGFVGTEEVYYTVCDNQSPQACETATLYLTTLSKPNTTKAENDINQIPQDSTAQGNVLVNDVDAEDEDQDVSSIDTDGDGIPDTTPTAGSPISISSGGSPLGSITIDPETGEYSFTPESGFTGTVEIPMEICDSGSPQVCTGSVLTIEVIGNPSPTANNEVIAQDDTNTQEQGETTAFPILGNDNDPDGDAISVSAISGLDISGSPVSLTTTPTDVYDGAGNLAGQASVNASGEVIFTADNGFYGQVPIDYTISDGNGGSDSAQYVITVEESDAADNDTYANDDANYGYNGVPQTGDVSLNDNDPEGHPTTLSGATDVNGDPLTLGSSSSLPSGGTITLNDDGSYTYDPAPGFVGTEEVYYTVCDNQSPQACETATLYLTTLLGRLDFGDLPTAYGVAYAVLSSDSNEDDIPDDLGAVWLGTLVDSEEVALTSSDATGDQYDDGLELIEPAPPTGTGRTSKWRVTMNGNTSGTTVHYKLFMDWESNDSFDSTYVGSGVTGSPVSVDIIIPVPDGWTDGDVLNARLVAATGETAAINGAIKNGEVEDYQFGSNSVLPVELLSFEANAEEKDVSLEWTAISDELFKYYDLQYSLDSRSFNSLVELPKSNNNVLLESYDYLHSDAFALSSILYYRLVMYDADGSSETSKIIRVSNHVDPNGGVSIYPNPVGAFIDVETSIPDIHNYQIIDLSGKVIKAGKMSDRIDAQDLPAGIYFLAFRDRFGKNYDLKKLYKL